MSEVDAGDGARLDKWLWAARFFKTRQLAAEAVRGGKVTVNRRKAKPATAIHRGDRINIGKNGLHYEVRVVEPRTRRGPPAEAREMFEESDASAHRREEQVQLLRANRAAVQYDRGRPSKRDRRAMEQFRRQRGL
ncbi:MAG: RNA-binding S4 domain-containing protein [Gammaproteobacteria bacterium]|nr:RNA-binding S4 domain-containing protein [Gammaproteobacteria bacterium]MDD9799472.1 RNA-binding S4 domain-containing protein [Gammaproteobacteria bacterium]MDD9816035.1 RNA-binding S4 domain-containing protein [Gammaproteobacteria bacterium]MDD9850238.1 RNA-binding S4 domain-containing protein [Gammaproteobacteria bacterium]MDD9871031.1 RNA-binding S4 domain-containing protein [Gammaproteobacteria bacterium]